MTTKQDNQDTAASLSTQMQEKEDVTRVEPLVPCVETAGSTADGEQAAVTSAERTDLEYDRDQWKAAAMLKDRTRRAIRERWEAHEPGWALAKDFGVPVLFIQALCEWQMFADDSPSLSTQEERPDRNRI